MFGYILANTQKLAQQQLERYRACYCGLCRSLRLEYGSLSRLALTYDMTFLILLLGSLYEPSEQNGQERCVAHPVHPHVWFCSEITSYAAAMNTALAYYNCRDDWEDDRNLLRLAESGIFSSSVQKISERWPRQCSAMLRSLEELSELEQEKCAEPDACGKVFGNIMAELFVYKEDRWASTLRKFGQSLGQFIYTLDAVCDLENDRKRGRYNPLLFLPPERLSRDILSSHLTLLIGDACAEFEKLPLVQDADLLRNILYSGVWSKFYRKFSPEEKEAAI